MEKQRRRISFALSLFRVFAILCLVGSAAGADPRLPSAVVGSANLGASPYDDPTVVLDPPTTWIQGVAGPGFSDGLYAASMVFGAWNTGPGGSKLIVTVNTGGYLTVRFDPPIEHDPANWFGKDFLVFGNSAFSARGNVYPTTDMEVLKINNGVSGTWEPSLVSVSQDGLNWYDYTSGPYDDDYAPTQAFTWDRDARAWDVQLDWTKPVDPALTKSSFAGKTVADAIDMYNGSAGGAAFDISGLPLPLNSNGRKWIQYVKITGSGGEVDSIARVSEIPAPTAIAAAKRLADGASVRLEQGIVTATKSDLGDCYYVENTNRTCGIKFTGRSIDRGRCVILGGVMATANGERKLKVTSVEDQGAGIVAPYGLTNAALSKGLSTTGLLVKICGKAGSIDTASRTFTVDDGSGVQLKCLAPADAGFIMPGDGAFVTVTGISSCQLDAQQHVVPTLRLRAQSDVQ